MRVVKRGRGKVTFKPSHHDPLSDLKILELRSAVYSEGDVYAQARRIGTMDAKSFLPYAFQNIDDYSGEI